MSITYSFEVFTPGVFSILGLGFILGLKHATDADHLVAVSTIVGERKGIWSSTLVGIVWGVGHTASLLIVGLAVVAFHFQIPEKVAIVMELAVAIMLVALGVNVLVKIRRGATLHAHEHAHDRHRHVHLHVHPPGTEGIHEHLPFNGKKPFLVGMVHGLAGSAALMLVVLATIPSQLIALVYIGMFGIGSVGGMLLMSTFIGIPFAITSRHERFHKLVRLSSGIFSVGFGLFYAWNIARMIAW